MFRQYATEQEVASLRSRVKACNSLKQYEIAVLCGEHEVTTYLKMAGKRKMPAEQYRMIDSILSEAMA
jgi:hypothetical protein